MKKISLLARFALLATFAIAQEPHASQWSYEGASGPDHWGKLNPEYSACSTGLEQSPINIAKAARAKLPPIEFHYSPSALRVIDNGHTVQVNYEPGSYITVAGSRYELVQFHFHHPSEEEINGRRSDLVIHLVHKDAEGHLAVVAVLFNQGADNQAIATLVGHLPQAKNQETTPSATIDAARLLPQRLDYYTFAGSLTTPPCSEGVTWFVLQAPATLSSQDLRTLARLYPHNARPIQPLNSRSVKSSN